MVTFPNCKINLGLHVVARRPDGYHDLETIFYPVLLRDALEIVCSKILTFNSTGLSIDGDVNSNLCVKAWQLLKADFPDLPPVDIHLHKVIPMGAGLGGGSSNGTFMLNMLNKKFDLQINAETLMKYALKLGSDCPFFIQNIPALAKGRGEKLMPISCNLSDLTIVIIYPSVHISTGVAFSRLSPTPPSKSLEAVIRQPIETWKEDLVNDFERVIFELYPFIALVKEKLYESGAVYASLSGSGSSVYALFKGLPILPEFEGCRTFVI